VTARPRPLGAVTSLEEHVRPDWWQQIFNSVYLKTDADVVDDPALTQAEADLFSVSLGLSPAHRVLDLCCGQGRHALELARRGFKAVDGFDRSRYLISRARKTALSERLPLRFREGDARKLPYLDGSFDRVYIAGNSFGYFSEPQDDSRVLAEVRRVLAVGGRLLLDLSDGDWVRKNFEPHSWEWIGPRQFVCRERSISPDGQTVTSREMVADVDKGVQVDQFYAARLYDREAISALLDSNGFANVNFAGEYETKSQKNQDLGLMGQRLIVTADVRKVDTRPSHNGNAASHAMNGNGSNGHSNGHSRSNGNGNGHAPATANGHGRAETRGTAADGTTVARKTRVAVIQGDPTRQDLVKPNGSFDEDDFETIGLLKTALSRLEGYEFSFLDNHATLFESLASSAGSTDLVLNLCDEGYKNDARLELHVPAMLDVLDIPYTGAGPQSLAHCYDKSLVRGVAREIGVPVAPGVFVNPGAPAPAALPFAFPVIVKPNFGDSSFGITQKSVARDAAELNESIATVRRITGGQRPVIVERLLTGADVSVGLMGNPGAFHVLPVTQEDYSAVPADMPKICGYEAKWDPQSPYWNILSVPARIPAATMEQIVAHCKTMFQRLGCRDYARFDWRLDAEGNPHMLEVNPNPGWCWDGHLAKMCKLAGMSYPQMLGLILSSAEQRIGLRPASQGDRTWPVVETASTELTALRAF
jgi:D-alanine-D-alanine ligase